MGDKLANHKSAIKRHKQSLKHALRNRIQKTRIKNSIKNVYTAIAEKDSEKAQKRLSEASSVLARAASKGAVHWKKVARKISRTARAVNAMNQPKK